METRGFAVTEIDLGR